MFLAGLLAVPAAAGAEVIEIDPAGGVKVYDGPMAIKADGAVEQLGRAGRRRPASRRLAPTESRGIVTAAADAAELSPSLIDAVAWRESRSRPRVISPAGAIGEMQLMPATARALGVDPFDTSQNYRGGAAYLKSLMVRYDGDLVRALAAYNAGPGAVDRYGGMPPFKETRTYVADILDHLSATIAPLAISERGK